MHPKRNINTQFEGGGALYINSLKLAQDSPSQILFAVRVVAAQPHRLSTLPKQNLNDLDPRSNDLR
jgi:hypothetical protein